MNLLTYPWPIRVKNTRFRNNPDLCKRDLSLIGHFWVLPGLCFKTRVGAQPLIWKSFFILMQIKLIFTRKVVRLASFWKWGFLELGSGLFSLLVLSGLKYVSSSHASLNDYFSFLSHFLGQWTVNKCHIWILEETIKYHYPELVANAKRNEEVIV